MNKSNNILKALVVITPFLLVALHWLTDPVRPDNLLYEAPTVRLFPALETRWLYAYLHIFSFLPVFALSFDKNVHYYKKWKYLLPGIGIAGIAFIVWDVIFTWQGVWGFNEDYFLGVRFLYLPIEEWLFFVTIPFCCVFIYECLNFYIKKDLLAPLEAYLTPALIAIFLGIGLWHWGYNYTFVTFLSAGGFLLYHYIYVSASYRSRFYLAFLISLLPFLIVNGILTGGYTEEPVVVYNPEEYLGIRITSVPLDDSVYGFLLLLWVVTIFEKSRA